MLTDTEWLILLLMIGLLLLTWLRQPSISPHASVTARVQRLLKPRTPHDCPICPQQLAHSAQTAVPPTPIIPWRERKSRRGRPKRINTHGFACPNRTCPYFRISDAQIHALVGDGVDGTCEPIQSLRCQACNTTFSTRRDTPLYRLKTASLRVAEVLTALAEGVDIAAATRIFGHRHTTITTWLTRAGEHSATLHDHIFQHLHLPHLQLDELRTRLRSHTHVLWLWVVIDPLSKIIPVLHLGARTQDAAHRVIHDLCQRLAPGCMPVFTSDG
jgi:transposase-like protein